MFIFDALWHHTRIIPQFFVFAYVFGMGVYSVWFAMFCDWVFRIIFFIPRYLSGAWLKKYKFTTDNESDNDSNNSPQNSKLNGEEQKTVA